IGFTGKAIVILNKPIDDEFPTRFFAFVERVTEKGVFITYEDLDEDAHKIFIPFGNLRGIEKDESPDEPQAENVEQNSTPPQDAF
ncbi:hypothetical protein ACFLQ2_05440, partial [archaeon]